MEEIEQLSDDVYEQIKDFNRYNLTEEQESLIDKPISDEELNKKYGLCNKCKRPKSNHCWCQACVFQRNFKNWTSGNDDVDKFIQKSQLKAEYDHEILEWIEHDSFESIEYLAKGGFGTVFRAIWKDGPWKFDYVFDKLERKGKTEVALKCLHNSQDITTEFLKEIETHLKMSTPTIVQCYGISKDPETNNFMMVMEYAENGSLRQYLNNNFISLTWNEKLNNLYAIALGIKGIHEKGFIHHDFHCGNILNKTHDNFEKFSASITDLGLCKPANETHQKDDKNIYGVLPYVAPEVLRGKDYTQASDIYGFGLIAYEICTGLPPYNDIAHDEFLAIKICQGLRPKSNYKIPQLILDIIQQCWDADPLKRPNAEELLKLFRDLSFETDKNDDDYEENAIINNQIKEAEEINKRLPFTAISSPTGTLSYTTHPQAIYTSKLLDFKNLPKPKNVEPEYSESIRMDLTKLNINSEDEN